MLTLTRGAFGVIDQSHTIGSSKVVDVCWLLNVPATCEWISGTDLLGQLYVLPHWDRNCRSNVLPHPATVCWHRANQSQCWPYNATRLAGSPLECQFFSHWYDSTLKKSRRKRDSNPGSSALEADALTTRPTRRSNSKGAHMWTHQQINFSSSSSAFPSNFSGVHHFGEIFLS